MRIIMSLLFAAGIAAPAFAALAADTDANNRACLSNNDISAKQLSSENGYFARTRAGWWHNTGAACAAFGADRALKTNAYNDRQCRGDTVAVFHPFSRIDYGTCVLGAWEKVAGPPASAAKPQGR